MSNESIIDVAVIGGGISGLAAAYYLRKNSSKPLRVLLLEGSGRLGGNIQTYRENDCILDAGPDSFVTTKPWALELCKELGLEDQLLSPNEKLKTIYAVQKNQLRPLPKGMILGAPTQPLAFLLNPYLSIATKFRMALEWFYLPAGPKSAAREESVATFMKRHFGQNAVDLIFEPILAGIYAARAKDLSLNATFPQFQRMESEHGSLIRAMKKQFRQRHQSNGSPKPIFLTLKNGMGQLVEQIHSNIPDNWIRLNQRVKRVRYRLQNQSFSIDLENESIRAKNTIIALPTLPAAELLLEHESVANTLKSFPVVSTSTVFLAFRSSDLSQNHIQKLQGLGFVSPRNKPHRALAGTWISLKFPNRSPENIFLMRLFWGGAGSEQDAHLSEDEIILRSLDEVKRIMRIDAPPLFTRVFYWSKTNPQYSLGHFERMNQMNRFVEDIPGLHLIGNSYEGIGIPDCIRLARSTTEKILAERTPLGAN